MFARYKFQFLNSLDVYTYTEQNIYLIVGK
jgi:hypothetical protein